MRTASYRWVLGPLRAYRAGPGRDSREKCLQHTQKSQRIKISARACRKHKTQLEEERERWLEWGHVIK